MTLSNGSQLVAFLADISVADLPADVIRQAKACLLDGLGCGVFGADQEWVRILRDEMTDEGGQGRASLFGAVRGFPAPAAALCNGTAIHGFELDDLIAASVVHPAAAVIPAALAAAEASAASGARMLGGIVAGYEAMHRIGLALGVSPARRGFHTSSLVAPIAAAVAAGVTQGFSAERLASAVGLAASAASGIKSFAAGHGGGMVKRLHLGRAAEAGVRMCQLAERGFSGPPQALDSRFGLLEVYGGEDADGGRLTRGLGDDWAVRDVWFKVYPICGWIQPVVQLLVSLRGPGSLHPSDIAAVRVGVSSYAARNNGEPAPIDTMGAQYSIPFCAATALLGDARDPRMFRGDALNDPATRALARRVEIVVDPDIEAVYPGQFGARVAMTTADGARREDIVLDCHGTPADPCSEAEHLAKFRILCSGAMTGEGIAGIVRQVEGLESLASVEALAGLLRSAGPAVPAAAARRAAP